MIIFPAIDLKDGKCVRLKQGKFDEVTVFSENPGEMAKEFERKGAEFIHLVDLDGALEGELKNKEAIEAVVKAVNIPVELGGGIRDIDRIEKLLELGLNRVILGTIAVKNPELVKEAVEKFGAEKIVVGIDAKNGMVAIKGWVEITEKKAIDLVKEMQDMGVKTIIYTDIAKDGMLEGVNLEETKYLLENANVNIVASGGVSNMEDIKKLKEIDNGRLEGVISGKAIYEGSLDLVEAINFTKNN